mgnify:CR=1 FL=1
MTTIIKNIEKVIDHEACIMAYGHFTTIHPGHIRYLKHAKSLGNKLVIAVVGDQMIGDQPRYPFKQNERAEGLDLLGIADTIVLLESDNLTEAIKRLKPAILVLGRELQGESSLELPIKLLESQGGSVQFHAGDVSYATANLLVNNESELTHKRKIEFSAACSRQGISKKDLINSIGKWSKTRLIVLGDTILDQYAACEALGMSAEAPVVVVKELAKRNFIGAAAVVAAHIKALGANVQLISVTGDDENANIIEQALRQQGIGNGLVRDPSRPTTFKKRYVVENQKLFRVSKLEQGNVDRQVEDKLISKLEEIAPKTQGIVVSDFVYGVITPRILETVEKLTRKYDLLLFGDIQCSSQIGSITKFKNFTLLSPNERELRLALQDKDSGIERLSQRILNESKCDKLIVKLAGEGFIAYDRSANGKIVSQPFPALSVNPVDVAGAGDSVLAVMATGLASGQSMMNTSAIACCMAELAVETMGNTPISAESLKNNILGILSL